jgi:Holliday junction resolvasome RuvABC endonuclease subunit
MTKIPSTSHGLTHPTTQNINLLHVRAGAPKEKLRYPESDVSDPVSTVVGPATQAGGVLTILAIDLGTTTGWAMRARDHQIAHGFVSLKPQRFEGGGMRFLRFKRWLSEIHTMANDIHAVYFEEVRRHAGVDAAHVYGGLMATLTTWCEHRNVPYQGVPVGTIKKHATGKGNAGKDDVIAAMRAKGHPVTDDNEADALALLHWAIDTQEA